MKVYFTTTAKGQHPHAAPHLIELGKKALQSEFNQKYFSLNDSNDADLIIYVEPWYIKHRKYIFTLLSENIIIKSPKRCFAIDCADTSWGLIPGVYTGLRASQINRKRFRSGGYLTEYNSIGNEVFSIKKDIEPKLLFSFRGQASSDTSLKIFESNFSRDNMAINRNYEGCHHSDKQKLLYTEELINSKFVLCPGGNCPASIRLWETMKMGRVPVILSDDWVAPDKPTWLDFSMRVSESKIHELPEIIERYVAQAFTIRKLAREAWKKWFILIESTYVCLII